MPTKVKLDKSDLAELREYRTNKKSTLFEPIKFKLGAFGKPAQNRYIFYFEEQILTIAKF